MKSLLLLFLVCSVQSGKILLWCPVASKSMKITFMPVVERLASNGHEVTLVTAFPSKEKIIGVTEIHAISNFEDITNGFARLDLSYFLILINKDIVDPQHSIERECRYHNTTIRQNVRGCPIRN